MQCSSRILVGDNTDAPFLVRCGQCMECRVRRQQEWALRILLECFYRPHNTFITLTYSDDYIPEGRTLSKRDCQLFIKRLRKNTKKQFRYFLAGEYGPQTNRPHYHAILFGMETSSWLEQMVTSSWNMGYIQISPVNSARARYVASYATKGLSETLLQDGQNPEFALMSRRPGIGFHYMLQLASTLKRYNDLVTERFCSSSLLNGSSGNASIAISNGLLRFEGKLWPMDNYTKKKLIEYGVNPMLLNEECGTPSERSRRNLIRSGNRDLMEDVERAMKAKARLASLKARSRNKVL